MVQIEEESNAPPWSLRLFKDEFHLPYSRVYGARLRGVLAGFLIQHLLFEEAHIVNFAVRRSMRGVGVGRALIVGALRELYELSVLRATLEVRRGNVVAQSLYDSLGFVVVGVRPKYYSDKWGREGPE
jgi:ribosomal-protein-alanine N-acetyltransferase